MVVRRIAILVMAMIAMPVAALAFDLFAAIILGLVFLNSAYRADPSGLHVCL